MGSGMQRYFFDIRNNDDLSPDEESIEFPVRAQRRSKRSVPWPIWRERWRQRTI
jgi:hypothetical protein